MCVCVCVSPNYRDSHRRKQQNNNCWGGWERKCTQNVSICSLSGAHACTDTQATAQARGETQASLCSTQEHTNGAHTHVRTHATKDQRCEKCQSCHVQLALWLLNRGAQETNEWARDRVGEGECLLSSSEAFVKWEIREEERLISPLLSPCWELNGGSVSLYSCARPEVSKWSSSVKTGKSIIIVMHHITQKSE